ncbi:type III PLP-dependent enzyme [Streptomyces sp. NPDC052496]|uniref:type III PLP-dependent enzyme n=1 Tax=Streptomyces sp. NPDC052496 TaxID=3154951 RepID=UPI00342BF564
MSDLRDAAGYQGPTPAYVYDMASVRTACDQLRAQLPAPSDLYYSLKANPHPAVVAALHARGCRAEISSVGELEAALAAGVPPRDILYSGPGKRDSDLDAALAAGVRGFSLDSAHAAYQLDAAARRNNTVARFLLRVNTDLAAPGAGLAMTGLPSPFGAEVAAVEADPAAFTQRSCARFEGLHLYLATNLMGEAALVKQFTVAIDTAEHVQRLLDTPLRVLDLGGGFGAPYAREGRLPLFPDLADQLAGRLDSAFPGWRQGQPAVAFESGRHLAATCGRLYTRVLDVKQAHGRRVVVLDTGIHHLGGMSGLRRVPAIRPQLHRHPATPETAEQTPTMVCGPLCTPLDTWAQSAPMAAVAPGDLLSVPNVGAYGLHASLVLFLGHPLPVEVVVDGPAPADSSQLRLHRTAVSPSA